MKLAMQLHAHFSQPRIPELAGTSARFAELIVELEDRKPTSVIRASYYLLRFSEGGIPDSARLGRQMIAAVDWSWMTQSGENKKSNNVIDKHQQFVHRGARWSPTAVEVGRIEDAALGRLKTSRLVAQQDASADAKKAARR